MSGRVNSLIGIREICSKFSSLFYSEFLQNSFHYAFVIPKMCSFFSTLFPFHIYKYFLSFAISIFSKSLSQKISVFSNEALFLAGKMLGDHCTRVQYCMGD